MRRMIVASVLAVTGLGLSGCASAMYDAIEMKSKYSEAELQKARQVRFMPDSMVNKKCKFITQVRQEGVAYDVSAAQDSAERWLRFAATNANANTVSIVDRMITKNKMTKKISLTANLYRCR